jgi:cell division protein FtsI/penicillin-binding protein 2
MTLVPTSFAGFSFPAPLPHTSRVSGFTPSLAILLASAALGAYASPKPAPSWQISANGAAQVAPEARILVLDVASGRLLAEHGLGEAQRTLAAPGSTLKPIVLYSLIANGRWNPGQRVACDRKLVVAGHRLACTHPPAPPFDAREALAWSCNSYFAQVARTLRPGDLGRILRTTGLLGITGLASRTGTPVQSSSTEASAVFREPMTPEAAQLALLGVEGIRITPLELAVAYRWLALQLAASPQTTAAQVINAGLADSAGFGMARQVSHSGASVAGKTGTAEGTVSTQSHGWFAGLVPAYKPRVVVVVYLPAGHGADAARVAAELLAHSPVMP